LDKEIPPKGEELNQMTIENDPVKDFFYFLWDLLKTGVIVFLIAFSIRYFLVQPFIVEGNSMLPNFVDQEYLLAEKISYIIGQPKRGDVVIFKPPANPSQNYIKRIIGLPGETVEISESEVKIINGDHPKGKSLGEEYIPKNTITRPLNNNDKTSVTLGDNQYFVLGDNREHSSDSREWGLLPKVNIIGRAWLTIKPLDRFGIQHRIDYSINYLKNSVAIYVLPAIHDI
jgi:signal peptidase I